MPQKLNCDDDVVLLPWYSVVVAFVLFSFLVHIAGLVLGDGGGFVIVYGIDSFCHVL